MINGRNLFNLILLIVLLIMVIYSFKFNPKAQLFPLYVGALTLIMLLWQFLRDQFPSLESKFKQVEEVESDKEKMKDELEEPVKKEEVPDKKQWFVALQCIVAMGLFTLLLTLIPYYIAVPIFLLLFIWLIGKAKFVRALSIAVIMSGFMYVLFDLVLHARI